MRETWYVLEDGAYADPNEVSTDEYGKLVHKSGVAVAMRGAVPSSRSVDPEEERAKLNSGDGDDPANKNKDLKPGKQQKPGYKTRDTKAD